MYAWEAKKYCFKFNANLGYIVVRPAWAVEWDLVSLWTHVFRHPGMDIHPLLRFSFSFLCHSSKAGWVLWTFCYFACCLLWWEPPCGTCVCRYASKTTLSLRSQLSFCVGWYSKAGNGSPCLSGVSVVKLFLSCIARWRTADTRPFSFQEGSKGSYCWLHKTFFIPGGLQE